MASYDAEKQMLLVSVSDTGSGISEEEMPQIFHLFGKVHRTAEQNHEGLGMGLMICKAIVEACSGTIEAKSEGEGRGSTFTFTMQMRLP